MINLLINIMVSQRYTGIAAATTCAIKDSSTGGMRTWSLLDAFGVYGALTVDGFQRLPQTKKIQRRDDFLVYLDDLYGQRTMITGVNDFVFESADCEPADIEYVFTASRTVVSFDVNGGAVDVGVVSTANGRPAPYSFTRIDGLQITQDEAGLRIVAAASALYVSGTIVLTQGRRQEDDGVVMIEVVKNGAALYAGGRDEGMPPVNESEVKGLATQAPVGVASPFVVYNPAKGDEFEFSAPEGTMTVCVVVPATLGALQRVASLEPVYDMTTLFVAAGAQVMVDGVACNVYYCEALVAFGGQKRLVIRV